MTNGLNTTAQPAVPQMGLNIFKYRGLFLRIVIDNNGEPWVVTRMVVITKFALRDMNPDGGNTTIGGTAKLIGTRGSRLLGFLLNNHVLSTSTASGVFPLKPFKDRGYFVSFPELFGKQLNVLCPEVSITPAGRRWLHHNAALGWLDKILDKDVLATRFTPVTDLPLPLSAFDPMLP